MWTNRKSVDFPAPLCPVRKQNSPFLISKVTSSSANPERGYCLYTWSNRIITTSRWNGVGRGPDAPPAPAPPTSRMHRPGLDRQCPGPCRDPARYGEKADRASHLHLDQTKPS